MSYRVLARKYRPATLTQLVGQDALVRTLTNAFKSGRVAQAYMLTGVRGVGKTTTARIIAKAMNCTAPGVDGPTPEPCGVCDSCVAIAEDRHMDVLEMDAASHTGIDDIREIIDGVRYRPVSGRAKVYIIDEIHMLSEKAFNALLKTLEEPPEHALFVFATTDIRKVPVTILSRCQRFDLRRVDMALLQAHFATVAVQEQMDVEPGALALIARAADGSVRDGLSLLDQAIAQAEGPVTTDSVRDMLGLADRTAVFALFGTIMSGNVQEALDRLDSLLGLGADPLILLQDLMEITHWLTRLKVAPGSADDPLLPETQRTQAVDLAKTMGLGVLSRTWQMLAKGLTEVRGALLPAEAMAMLVIRLCYAVDLPDPADVVRGLREGTLTSSPAPGSGPGPVSAPPQGDGGGGGGGGGISAHAMASPASVPARGPVLAYASAAAPQAAPTPTLDAAAMPGSFEAVVQLALDNREMLLATALRQDVHLIHYEPGRMSFRPSAGAPDDLAKRLRAFLAAMTGQSWLVATAHDGGSVTLAERDRTEAERRIDAAKAHPLVQSILAAFPGATVSAVTPHVADHAATDEPTDLDPDEEELPDA